MQAAARRLSVLFATTALFAAGNALAQTAPATAPADAGPETALSATDGGELVVTASKRSERLRDVPAAVAAVRADDLITAGVHEARDLNGLVPGLTVAGGFGSGSFVVRGLSSGQDVNPVTGLQIDGAPIGPVALGASSAAYMPQLDPAIISRIEVLKGPQGTLYGGSTLGGIVQFVTRKPNLDHTEGEVGGEASYTDHGTGNWNLRGYVSTPLVKDKLSFQASGFGEDLGGYLDDRQNGANNYNFHHAYGGRAALLWQVNPDFTIQISDLYSHLNSRSDQMLYTADGKPASGEDLVSNSLVLPGYRSKFNMVAANADYDLHWSTLSYIGTYQTDHHDSTTSYEQGALTSLIKFVLPSFGGAPVPADAPIGVGFESDSTKLTQEVRLTSPDSGRFRWLVGGFLNHEHTDAPQAIGAYGADQAPVPGATGDLLHFDLITHLTEVAGFGNLTFYITPKLDVTGGIRVGHVSQDYRQLSSGSDFAAFNALSVAFGLSPTAADSGLGKSSGTFETYLANVRYHFSDTGMAYFRFATGFRPGGPNTAVPGIPATFDPDTTKDYEVGVKSSFWDGRGYVDLNAYWIDWNGIQVLTQVNGLGGEINAGSAVSRGVEASLDLRPVDGLSLHGGVAYNDAYYSEDLPGGLGLSGDTLPNAPKWSGVISANYERPLSGEWSVFAGGQVRLVGERHAAAEHNLTLGDFVMPAYSQVDLQAGVRDGRVQANLFVRNLGDEQAQLGASLLGVVDYIAISRPRTIGVALSASF